MLTARANSLASGQNCPESTGDKNNNHLSGFARSGTSHMVAPTSISPSMSLRSSLEISNHNSSLQARGSSSLHSAAAPDPLSSVSLAAAGSHTSKRYSSVEALEDGKLLVRGPGTRARRMSIPCAPFEYVAGDVEPAESDEVVVMVGGGTMRRSSLISSDTPASGGHNVHHLNGEQAATGSGRSNEVIHSQSEVGIGHSALLASHHNMSKRSSVASGTNSISILDAANLAKQARCKVLSVMISVDESFALLGTLTAGSSSVYSTDTDCLNFNLGSAVGMKGERFSGLSAALRKLQGPDAFQVSEDSYTGMFDSSPVRGPSDRLNLILAQVDAWQFDTLELDEVTDGHALSSLGFALIKRSEAFRK